MEDGNTYRLTGWASWGISIYAGMVLICSLAFFLYEQMTNGPLMNLAAVLVGGSVLLTVAAALSASKIRITVTDEGIERINGAGRHLALTWDSIERLERTGTSQWNERHVLCSPQGRIVFDRTWERWEELRQEIQRRAYHADRLW